MFERILQSFSEAVDLEVGEMFSKDHLFVCLLVLLTFVSKWSFLHRKSMFFYFNPYKKDGKMKGVGGNTISKGK